MSLKTKVLKDMRRRVKRQKEKTREQIVLEILMLPFWQRLVFAWRTVWRSHKA